MINWFAIRTKKDKAVKKILDEISEIEEIYYPLEDYRTSEGVSRTRAILPHIIFIKAEREVVEQLEQSSRTTDLGLPLLWIYRYSRGEEIQPISEKEMTLLKLLTATDSTRCEVYRKDNLVPGKRVKVTGGPFAGLEGEIQRVKKNRHVVVRIEGLCAVLLPFIHPNLLEEIG